jgi:50S ribosomal protein L16 3-hydroxylase
VQTYERVLTEWLDPASRTQFLAHRQARRAFARPSIVRGVEFGWEVLGRVLASPLRDVLVTRDGSMLNLPDPDLAGVQRGLARGLGLVARRAERCEASLCDLARAFERQFARSAHVQLFVTPRGTRGFAWHYDLEDVVILQTAGRKSYSLRENSQSPLPDQPDFASFRAEVSPLALCTLCAGDALYIPRGMWHMGRAEEDAFSISVGLEHRLQG